MTKKKYGIVKKIKLFGADCRVSQCHPKSFRGKHYRFGGFSCPLCGNDKTFDLDIVETIEEETGDIDGHDVSFGCEGCGRVISIFWSARGVTLEENYKSAIRDYKEWKCRQCEKKQKIKRKSQ